MQHPTRSADSGVDSPGPDDVAAATAAAVALPGDLAAASGHLQDLLLDGGGLLAFLHQAAVLGASMIPGTSCGITFRRNRDAFTVASSDIRSAQLDELHYTAGQGPCLDALRSGREVSSPDLAGEDRWPAFRRRAREAGVGSVVAFPLLFQSSVISVGALNLYAAAPHAFIDTRVDAGRAFARQAATAITMILRHADQVALQDQLRETVSTRTVIDQALGILMGARRITADAAFEMLRDGSSRQNRKLSAVADDVIRSFTGQPTTPTRPFIDPR